jgi:hypothetical protein
MSDQTGAAAGQYTRKFPGHVRFIVLFLLVQLLAIMNGCGEDPA